MNNAREGGADCKGTGLWFAGGTAGGVVWPSSGRNGSSVKSNSAAARQPLFQRINSQAAEQFGVEVGRFLREHFAGQGNVSDLRHACRIHQEGHVGAFVADCCHRFRGITDVSHILLITNRIFRDSQCPFEQAFVQLHYIETLLAEGKVAKDRRWRFRPAEQKHTIATDRQ